MDTRLGPCQGQGGQRSGQGRLTCLPFAPERSKRCLHEQFDTEVDPIRRCEPHLAYKGRQQTPHEAGGQVRQALDEFPNLSVRSPRHRALASRGVHEAPHREANRCHSRGQPEPNKLHVTTVTSKKSLRSAARPNFWHSTLLPKAAHPVGSFHTYYKHLKNAPEIKI